MSNSPTRVCENCWGDGKLENGQTCEYCNGLGVWRKLTTASSTRRRRPRGVGRPRPPGPATKYIGKTTKDRDVFLDGDELKDGWAPWPEWLEARAVDKKGAIWSDPFDFVLVDPQTYRTLYLTSSEAELARELRQIEVPALCLCVWRGRLFTLKPDSPVHGRGQLAWKPVENVTVTKDEDGLDLDFDPADPAAHLDFGEDFGDDVPDPIEDDE